MRAINRMLRNRQLAQKRRKPTGWSVTSLFASGEQGVWYDPSDLKLNWRRNLLTYSEQFDNAVWSKTNTTVTANAAVAPDGTTTAALLRPTATSGTGTIAAQSQTISGDIGTYTASYRIKSSGFNWAIVAVRNIAGNRYVWQWFDLANGVVGSRQSSSFSFVSATIELDAQGFHICTLRVTTNIADSGLSSFVGMSDANNNLTATASGSAGIYVRGAQLEAGSTATEYQRITDGIQDYLTYQPLPILYQDSAGTTPVTAVEQPVGLMLDKSKQLVLGPELVTNGTFDADTWWLKGPNCAISGGAGIASAAASGSGWYKTGLLTVNTYYEITFTVVSCSAGAFRVGFMSTKYSAAYSTPGTYTTRLAADSTSFIVETVGTTTGSIDNVSVKQVTGSHAFQTTSTKRPVLSARVNLLTKTEALTDAAWTKTTGVVVTDNAALAPDGTMTATTIAFGAVSREVAQSFTATVGVTTPAFYVKGTAGQVLNFGSAGQNKLITLTGGWDLATATLTAGITKLYIGNYTGTANALNIAVWHPDLRVTNTGVNLPAYQRVNTATDYDTQGFPTYLKFDGIDDAMQTNSIDFTATDKMTVFAGVRKLSDAAVGVPVETSIASFSNNGSFVVGSPDTAATYSFGGRGTVFVLAVSPTNFAAPITNVLGGISDISGDSAILRVNGTQAAISTANQGTGNYGNYPLYIGARAGTSLFFNGLLYGLIVRGAQSTAAQIESTEKWVNGKTAAF